MCDPYLQQLLLLARHRVATFSTPKPAQPLQFDVCYDLPEAYEALPGYFTRAFRHSSPVNGTGGGRKQSKGALHDLQEGVNYFKSRVRVLAHLRALEEQDRDELEFR